jgi:hypothetical protein
MGMIELLRVQDNFLLENDGTSVGKGYYYTRDALTRGAGGELCPSNLIAAPAVI